MTTLQKTFVIAVIIAAFGIGIYEARQALTARAEVDNLKQQQTLLAEQLEQTTRERDQATRQLAIFRDDYERLNLNTAELARLRNEVGRLRGQINSNDPRDGGKTMRADALPALIDLYEQAPAEIDRCAIAIAFGEIGPAAKKAVPSLLRALDDPNLNVRRTAARALGGIHPDPDSVVLALIKHLDDQDPFVKQDVAYALADFGAEAKAAVPRLIELLQDSDKGVRSDAEKALKRIDAEAASNLGLK